MTLEVMKMFGVKARRNVKRGAAGSLVAWYLIEVHFAKK